METENYETILLEKCRDGIAILTLNRPDVLNAISNKLIAEMQNALYEINSDMDIKVLVITGAGKSFMAGADIKEINKMSVFESLRWNEGFLRINATIEKLRQPVIAAINGLALGGGFELVLACTIRIAAEGARLGLPEVKLGIIPGAGGTQRLPRIVGKAKAYEMLLTGDPINAEEAYRVGLVNKVVSKGEALNAAIEMARKIMENGPIAVELCKDAVEIGMDLPLEHAVQYSQKNCMVCVATEDMKEGTTAFIEKRKANFSGK